MNTAPEATSFESVHLLAFDMFGTTVDWHSGIARAVDALGLPVSGDSFALAWRDAYPAAIDRVRSGAWPWTNFDTLHRATLDALLDSNRITHLSDDDKRQLNLAWGRLDPWPDVVEGLTRLKQKYLVCALSNGNLSMLMQLTQHGGLPWDCIVSAETFKAYKPDPKLYLGAAHVCDVLPQQVMMVAAHQNDLTAARGCGMQTAYIERPREYGLSRENTDRPESANTCFATSFTDLATLLGC